MSRELPSAFRDSIRDVCGEPPDEATLFEPNPVMDALKLRMRQGRQGTKHGGQSSQTKNMVESKNISKNTIGPKDRRLVREPRKLGQRKKHTEARNGQAPVVCRDGECRLQLKETKKQPHDFDLPKPPIPPRKNNAQDLKESKRGWNITPTYPSFREAFSREPEAEPKDSYRYESEVRKSHDCESEPKEPYQTVESYEGKSLDLKRNMYRYSLQMFLGSD